VKIGTEREEKRREECVQTLEGGFPELSFEAVLALSRGEVG